MPIFVMQAMGRKGAINNLNQHIMKAIEILKTLEREPDLAADFGVSENLDLRSMFGDGSLCGAYPLGQYVWFWADRCPQPCPDFVLNVKENGSKVYGYFID